MAPEQVAESSAAAPSSSDGHRLLPTPFLTKTYQLVDDPAVDDVISWNEDGSAFVVWRPAEFARDLLPKYFKHNNFSSFVRQLNTYGFRKIVPDRWEFANDCFRRGERRLLCDIHRRKVQASAAVAAVPTAIPVVISANRAASPTNSDDDQVLSSNSSPGLDPSTSGRGSGGAPAELSEENHRLRKENERLKRELSQLKGLCNDILLLMSKYASQQQHQRQQDDGEEGACAGAFSRDNQAAGNPPSPPSPPPPPVRPSCLLELMPATRYADDSDQAGPSQENGFKPGEEGPSPRLFGVVIGQKRPRDGDEDTSAVDEPSEQHRAVDVKTEAAGPGVEDPPREEDNRQWRVQACRRLPSRSV